MPSILGKKQVEEMVTVILTETPTTTLFSLTSMVVASDLREVSITDEKNVHYEEVLISHKNADGFTSQSSQTLNNSMKSQNDLVAPNPQKEMGCQAVSYEITDATIGRRNNGEMDLISVGVGTDTSDLNDETGLGSYVKKLVTDTVNMSIATPGCLLDVTDTTKPPGPGDIQRTEAAAKGRTRTLNAAGTSTANVSGIGNSDAASGSQANVVHASSAHSGGGTNGLSQQQSASGVNVAGNGSGLDMVAHDKGQVSGNGAVEASTGGGAVGDSFVELDSTLILRAKAAEAIMSSPLLLKRLQMIERAVQQNAYHRQQLDYQSLPDIPSIKLLREGKKESEGSGGAGFGSLGGRKTLLGAAAVEEKKKEEAVIKEAEQVEEDDLEPKKIKKLFCFYSSSLVDGRSVTAMAWNAVNTDLLAVAYGKLDNYVETSKPGEAVDEVQAGGLVLFWSIRNPEYPEKILRTPFPVTSLDFSKLNPTVLGVGLINGDVNIYDIKRETGWEVPMESSAGMPGSHSDPVWDMKWIIKGIERFETLVSISTDGKVLEWNMKKGMVVTTIMQLSRIGTGEGWISRHAAGLSFSFVPNDATSYVVSTEEGSLHKCSISYSEQYLETYEGHDGPAYKVRFSQHWPNVFLSGSADVTMGIYHLKSKTPLIKMRATGDDFAYNDVAWCPGNSTVFASVTADAKLQIWDLSVSHIDPVSFIDTSSDDVSVKKESTEALPPPPSSAGGVGVGGGITAPVVPARLERFGGEHKDTKEESLVAKLIKNLSTPSAKKELTCLLFADKSPTVAVGDNRGAVFIYRIFDPITITNMGPLQQQQKLRATLTKLSDPSNSPDLLESDAAHGHSGSSSIHASQ